MSIRSFSIPVTLLATTLSLSGVQILRADEQPAPTAPAQPAPPATQADPAQPAPPAAPGDAPQDGERPRRREGGRGGGFQSDGPRGEGGRGGFDGQREGGFRRGEGGGFGGAPNANETPEQRAERMQRVLAPYTEMLPDLTDDQKTHILAILDASSAEMRALRANTSIPQERRTQLVSKLRGFLPEHIKIALTDPQIETYTTALAEQRETQEAMANVGSVRPDEDVEDLRARVLQGYEPFMEELSVKQKTQVIKVLEAAAEDVEAVNADTKLTPEQKKQALLKIHDGISAKVTPLLDADQKKAWKKAHDAKKP